MTILHRTLFCGAIGLSAVTTLAAGPGTDEADHAALRALVPVYEQAVARSDPGRLKPYLDPDFSAVMLTGDALDGPASIDTYWAKVRDLLGPKGSYQVKVNVAAPAQIDGALAVAHGTTDDSIEANGRHFEFHSAWTAVCRKGPDGWKLLRLSATIDPLNNPFVGAMVQRSAITAGAVAGVVMLVIGFLIGAVVFRRRNSGPVRP